MAGEGVEERETRMKGVVEARSECKRVVGLLPGGGREGSCDLARTESFQSHLVSWNFVGKSPSYGPKRVG